MAKLWDKGYDIDGLIERFTTGEDYRLDNRLVAADCAASVAHARMLNSIHLLTDGEFDALKDGLVEIMKDHADGRFSVTREDEDCHTAIENRLVSELGEAGKKIHTGRSRNDQVLAALRLYGREMLLSILGELEDLTETLIDFAENHAQVPMPGRTHLQIAMPSTVGLWAASFAEDLADTSGLLWSVYELYNQNPLGAAASYGVPLPLDRSLTAGLLGFRRVQNNVLYVNNSRGKFESAILDTLEGVMITLGKMSQDMILFSLPEIGYFELPKELCTGSSIMPQKKNPDLLELVRARAGVLGGLASTVKNIVRALPSGYNRDFQETKGPFLQGLSLVEDCLKVMKTALADLRVREDALRKGCTPEMYATDAALEMVAKGMSFRDAYREVGGNLEALGSMDADEAIRRRTVAGMPGNLALGRVRRTLRDSVRRRKAEEERIDKAMKGLLGFVPHLARRENPS